MKRGYIGIDAGLDSWFSLTTGFLLAHFGNG